MGQVTRERRRAEPARAPSALPSEPVQDLPRAQELADSSPLRLQRLLQASFSDALWGEILDALAKAAKQQNVRAAELLLKYAFGSPPKPAPPEPDVKPIEIIEIYGPRPDSGPETRAESSLGSGQSARQPRPLRGRDRGDAERQD